MEDLRMKNIFLFTVLLAFCESNIALAETQSETLFDKAKTQFESATATASSEINGLFAVRCFDKEKPNETRSMALVGFDTKSATESFFTFNLFTDDTINFENLDEQQLTSIVQVTDDYQNNPQKPHPKSVETNGSLRLDYFESRSSGFRLSVRTSTNAPIIKISSLMIPVIGPPEIVGTTIELEEIYYCEVVKKLK
jgi:hypothetical protein